MKISILLFFVFFFSIQNANAWGGRGHHTICDAATFLVKNKSLRDYLTTRPQMMGHLCNVPDFYWKSLGGDVSKWGNPTHYIDVEITGLKINEVPTDYKKVIADFQGKPNAFKKDATIFSIPIEFGSIWWRADQFYRRAFSDGENLKASQAPTNSKEEQDENLPYNKFIYSMVVNMGLMGHFVGDMGQPFHSSIDYDGYETGHGGIHSYYEDLGVSAQDYKLTADVVTKAKELQKLAKATKKSANKNIAFLTAPTVIDRMKALAILSSGEVKEVYKNDPIIKKSEVVNEKGMSIKKQAERKPIDVAAPKWRPLIVNEMARSAALLALCWDEIYEKIGEPKLAAYKSYKYPFTPDFVMPDYYDQPNTEKKDK